MHHNHHVGLNFSKVKQKRRNFQKRNSKKSLTHSHFIQFINNISNPDFNHFELEGINSVFQSEDAERGAEKIQTGSVTRAAASKARAAS